MPLTANALLDMSQDELDDLFRASTAGPIPVGEAAGTVIVHPGGVLADIVAEASVFSPRYHCDAIAAAPSIVASIPRQRLRDHLRADADFAGVDPTPEL